jgi:heterodisulfide reductase subunit A
MLDAGRHPEIDILAYSEVLGVEGSIGSFAVTVRRKPRYVKEDVCNACGDCLAKCPGKVPDEFDMNLRTRKAIYLYFAQGIPAVMTIDPDHCLYLTKGRCGVCQKTCQIGAIDFEQTEEIVSLDVGAIIVATGLEVFDPSPLTQYGYKRIANVITGLEYERLINATGPTQGHLHRPSDGRLAQRVAYIQCVGSRDLRYCDYCSAVCCMYSIKDAMLAREHDPKAESYIFHIDFRNVGKWFQKYEHRGRDEYGVHYVRGKVAEITEDQEKNPVLWYEDTEIRKVERLTVDMVVLATAAIPSAGVRGLAKILGIELDQRGFVKTGFPATVDTSVPGIYSCGFCRGPADIPESVAQASAAAVRAAHTVA